MHAHHHLHIRKRIYKYLEEYPHPEKWKRLLDYAVLTVGVLSPVITFVQVWKIWSEQNASSSSLVTWGMYFVASLVWFAYGMAHREKPIILSNILYIIATGFVLIGIAIF